MPSKPILPAMLIASLLLCRPAAHSKEGKSQSTTWQDTARRSGLSAESISSLKKNRILITNESYKQVFSAYLSSNNPLFITSDSLLNAYHVLYEESIYRLENAMAEKLPPILRLILKNIEYTDDYLKGKQELVSAAKRRAVIVTGIALKLTDGSFRFRDEKLDKILAREIRLIVQAEGIRMPAWLGKPDDFLTGLDYSRYKPRGFYTRSEKLRRYFRAVSWLQSMPFRVTNDEELLAILMLGSCVTSKRINDYTKIRDMELFFRAYSLFIGAGDDWDLMTAADEAGSKLRMDLNGDDLQKERARLMEKAKENDEGPQINDQIRFAPDGIQKAAEPNFRIISAYRTPGGILFQRTTDLRKFNRSYPAGLEVAISLGSAFARKSLKDPQKKDLLKTIDSCKSLFRGNSLYFSYLDAIRTLLDKPEYDAPDFMKTGAWQAKICNTVLAGWAQLRHTWVLQAKQTVHYLCAMRVPEGFVEPEPEFFGKMARLTETTQSLLKEAGAFDPDYGRIIAGLEKLSSILDGVKDKNDFLKRISELSQEDRMALELPLVLMRINSPILGDESKTLYREQQQWLTALAADLKKGQTGRHPYLKEIIQEYNFDLENLWQRLGKVSRQLEVISHKQLRHVDLNDDETAFIKEYGSTIAGIMLYGGNSYVTPRDDAPRVVDIYANPQNGGYLHAGIARARKMYVLYPWKGRTILCEGAILPYYEFISTSRLTDESWKKMLDSDKRPSIPGWVSPVVSGGRLSKPSLKKNQQH